MHANPVTGPRVIRLMLATGLLMAAGPLAAGERCVTDDEQREVCLDAPAERIIALSPGATELLFAAGAGDKVVAAVSYSDYPEQAKELPRVGGYQRLDLEAILAKDPDLIIGWSTGNPPEQLEDMEDYGATLYYSEPRTFEDVATTLERLGRLAGTEEAAGERAERFREDIAAIEQRYADADPVRVFYQVWDEPLRSVNNEHLISRVANLCGGENVFGELERLVPTLDKESVLEADPEAIVAGGMGEADDSWLDMWREFEGMTAVRRDNLFFVPPSSIQRPTPRVAEGAGTLCEELEKARERR